MIDRAKLAKGYITDEYLNPMLFLKSDMKDTYVDEMEICSEFEEGIEKQEFQVFISRSWMRKPEKSYRLRPWCAGFMSRKDLFLPDSLFRHWKREAISPNWIAI